MVDEWKCQEEEELVKLRFEECRRMEVEVGLDYVKESGGIQVIDFRKKLVFLIEFYFER